MAGSSREIRQKVLCDTNVIVRFLTADSRELSPAAGRAIEAAAADQVSLVVTDVVVAEAVFVLVSVYGLGERDVADRLIALLGLPGIECASLDVLGDALGLWGAGGLRFVDAYLAAMVRGVELVSVLSFDRDFDGIEGVDRIDPATY